MKRFLHLAIILSSLSCGGGGGATFLFTGNWQARNIRLLAETCSQALNTTVEFPLQFDDVEYRIDQDGSTILYSDEDDTLTGIADGNSFTVTAPDEVFDSILDGNVVCLGAVQLIYDGESSESGTVTISIALRCEDVNSGQATFRCEVDYVGQSTRVAMSTNRE